MASVPNIRHLLGSVVVAALLLGSGASAQVIVNDTFSDGNAGNPTAGTRDPLSIPWFNTDVGGTSTPIVTTGRLDVRTAGHHENHFGTLYDVATATATSESALPNATLGASVGDRLRLSLDLNVESGNGLVGERQTFFGLFNSNGTPLVGNNSPAADDDDFGYVVRIDHVSSDPLGRIRKISALGSGTTEFDGGTTLGSDPNLFITTATFHTLELELERLTAGVNGDVRLSFFIDDPLTPVLTALDTSGTPFSSFDQIGFTKRQSNNGLLIDNVVLEQFLAQQLQIPEPASWAMFSLVAVVGLVFAYRGHRMAARR